MPDWKKIVREKLGNLPLTNGRRDEVIEELAQQLESAYEEALAQGINEQEAMRRSLDQFKDWEKLRNDVFQSVEGTHLPVWEQNGIFAPRRWPVWISLPLTLALFATPTFRQALTIIPIPGRNLSAWNASAFSEKALRRIEQSGDKQKLARTLAYLALHSPKEDDLRAVHAAEKAIALDPQLTWISAHVSHATYLVPGYDPHPWIERLKAWDPQNGFPYLLEADANVHWWEPSWTKYNATPTGLRAALVAEPRWRIPMEKAFAAPRIDSYTSQQFALDRQVLQEQGLDEPATLIIASASAMIPDLGAIKTYASYQLHDVGEAAEKTGHPDEALAAYWNVAHFGEKLHAGNSTEIEEMMDLKLRREAYEKMLPLLRRGGYAEEAAGVEAALAGLPILDHGRIRPIPYPTKVRVERSARLFLISAISVVILGIASTVWLISLIALNWKKNLSAALNNVASLLCFAPPALALASFTLFVAYYPYAQPVGQFTSAKELFDSDGLFLMSLFDMASFGDFPDVWLARMFWPSVWCAIIALVGACLLWWVRRRTRPDRPAA